MLYGMELTQKYTNPGRNACFALALARQENCPLLTTPSLFWMRVDHSLLSA